MGPLSHHMKHLNLLSWSQEKHFLDSPNLLTITKNLHMPHTTTTLNTALNHLKLKTHIFTITIITKVSLQLDTLEKTFQEKKISFCKIQNTHIHHHYHHQGEPSTGYTREDISGEENFFLQDSNQVKRKAENFFGSQPNIGGESSSSSSGFRFPRGRDGRNLKLTSEETEGVESLEQEENEKAKAANEESIVKSGSSFKFSERKKRSPDGIGNHGHHGHHDPNAHLGHHDPTAHHGAHSQHIPDTRSGPFGPNGFRPPKCGGPSSGFVCCSVHGDSGVGFNELTGENTIRDTRQEPQQLNQLVSEQQFSTFGQCGRRNAHGVNGRINTPAQVYNEGDTEFGEYP